MLVFLQLGTSDTLSVDVSSIVRDDFDASVEASVSQLVSGWTPLLDSSLKGSAVVNASANASYEQYEVGHNRLCEETEISFFGEYEVGRSGWLWGN